MDAGWAGRGATGEAKASTQNQGGGGMGGMGEEQQARLKPLHRAKAAVGWDGRGATGEAKASTRDQGGGGMRWELVGRGGLWTGSRAERSDTTGLSNIGSDGARMASVRTGSGA